MRKILEKMKKEKGGTLNYGWKHILCNILSAVVGGLIVIYHQPIIHGLAQVICSAVVIVTITIAVITCIVYAVIKYTRRRKKRKRRLEALQKRREKRQQRTSFWDGVRR
jgi:heme/copper-type cytochrome/quinol oxidase subunit 2